MKESGLILNEKILLSLRSRSRRKSSIFFDTVKRYNEKTMEQFNSGESRVFFKINFHKSLIGRMIVRKHAWQQEEEQQEDISIALIIQEQFFNSVLFRDTLDVISLIFCDNVIIQRGLIHHIYHIGCAFNLHSIINNGLILGGQNSSKRKTDSFCLLIPETKGTKILKRLT